jgi:surface protein
MNTYPIPAVEVGSTPEPYVVLTDSNTVMTFYYDGQKATRVGIDINNSNLGDSPSPYGTATSAVFDASFANYYPTSTAYWFQNCSALTSISGVENLKTDNVTNMAAMFMNCTGLTTLDLSSFNTAKVENMDNMFCQNSLTTIYVDGTKWNTGAVTSSISMFYMCPNLVGGQGTVYDINRVDASYAHIDGGTSNPGYFTPKSGYVEAPTFAWNADELTMTSGTDGATIYYTLTDAVTSTPTPTQYTAPITVTSDVLIEAYAEKDGMARSMTTTLNYPYTAWKALVDAIADAQNVLAQANTNDNVTA